MRNTLKWRGLRALVAGLLLAPLLALGQSTGLGEITEISHDQGYLYISDKEYTFVPSKLQVTIRGQAARLVYLQRGMFVRFEADARGELTKVELIGPPQRINEILNQ